MYSVEHSSVPDYIPLRGVFRGLNRRARRALIEGDFRVEPRKKSRPTYIRSYRTVFGPSFAHSGVVYAVNRENLGAALYRLFHDKCGIWELYPRQEVRCSSPAIRAWAAMVNDAVMGLVGAVGDWPTLLEEVANLPHPKRELRVRAAMELNDDGRLWCPSDDFMYGRNRYVMLKQKPREWGKSGKFARVICDLGTPASLRAGVLFESIKKAMASTPLVGDSFSVHFVPVPNVRLLTKFFREMMTRNMALVFSDDMALSVHYRRCDGTIGRLYAEVDISGCDASQGPAVWDLARRLVPTSLLSQFDATLSQALKPCVVGHGREKMLFQPMLPREYSGIIATTVLNNCSSFCIAYHLLSQFPLLPELECRARLQERLEECGWRCTLLVADNVERLTFLKHSPVLGVDGQYYAALNLGVILRSLGQKTDDLPGSGDLVKRAFEFNSGLVKGLVHSGNTALLRLLQRKFDADVKPVYNSYLVEQVSDGPNVVLHDASLLLRYGLSQAQYEEMLFLLEIASMGDVIDCEASRRIMDVDYGL